MDECKKDLIDLSCYCCGEKGNFSHSCPIKREDAHLNGVITLMGLIKVCRNKNNKKKKKSGKGEKKTREV